MENKNLIPWDLIDEKYKHARIDEDRRMYAYVVAPKRSVISWGANCVTNDGCIHITDILIRHTFRLDWKTFKVTRPADSLIEINKAIEIKAIDAIIKRNDVNKANELALQRRGKSIASLMYDAWVDSRDYTNATPEQRKIRINWCQIGSNFDCIRINSDRRLFAFPSEKDASRCGQNGRWLTNGLYAEVTDLVKGDTSKLDSSSFIAYRDISIFDEEELINDFEKELNLLIAGSFVTTRNLVIDLLKKFTITRKGD